MRARDSQRARLYTAERTVIKFGNVFGSLEDTQAWVNKVLAARWFRSRWNIAAVTVRPGGRGARSGGQSISLGTWARNPMVALHELAHQVISRGTPNGRQMAAHGPEFAAVYLFLVKQVIGEDTARELRAAFVQNRVRHRVAAVIPEPRFEVPTQAVERARRQAALQRPVYRQDRIDAAFVIRSAVRTGEFGRAGTKARTAALAVARALEKEST